MPRKIVIRAGTGRPIRAETSQVHPSDMTHQPMVVHHYYHDTPQNPATSSSGGGSLGFWIFLSLLFPMITVIVGIAFLVLPDRKGHGMVIIIVSLFSSLLAYLVLVRLGCL
jgi:hypothetical protein